MDKWGKDRAIAHSMSMTRTVNAMQEIEDAKVLREVTEALIESTTKLLGEGPPLSLMYTVHLPSAEQLPKWEGEYNSPLFCEPCHQEETKRWVARGFIPITGESKLYMVKRNTFRDLNWVRCDFCGDELNCFGDSWSANPMTTRLWQDQLKCSQYGQRWGWVLWRGMVQYALAYLSRMNHHPLHQVACDLRALVSHWRERLQSGESAIPYTFDQKETYWRRHFLYSREVLWVWENARERYQKNKELLFVEAMHEAKELDKKLNQYVGR